jgi:hypothetical protein
MKEKKQNEELITPVVDTVVKTPRITLIGINEFKEAIVQYREEIVGLVRDGTISEQTGAKIILDAEYSFFQQLVGVKFQ